VPISPSLVAELLPPGSGDWEPVTGGESGASVFRDQGHRLYAKIVPSELVPALAAERDRSSWLNQTAIPTALMLDWRETAAGACLVTQAVPGVPASDLDARALRRAWPSVAAAVRALHDLATDSCPFDRSLVQMMRLARATVAEGLVVVEFLPTALQDTPPAQILEQIEAELPVRLAQERAQLVVCHGDLCLPNILVDPISGQVTGLIDLGRLGTADPYGDLALLFGTARQRWTDESMARQAEEEFAETYGTKLERDREDFYRRLDPLTW
jgi:streptomycin 3"-kinase